MKRRSRVFAGPAFLAGSMVTSLGASATVSAILGLTSGNMGIRTGGINGAFHVRAGHDLEYKLMTAYIKDFGMRRIGVVLLQDTSKANLTAMTEALNTLSVAPVEIIAVDRTASSFAGTAAKLLNAKLECVLLATHAAPVAAIIDLMRSAKYAGLYFASSFAGQGLIDTLSAKGQGCILSMVVQRPSSAGLERGHPLPCRPSRDRPRCQSGHHDAGGLHRRAHCRGGSARMKESLAALHTDLGGYSVDFSQGSAQGSQYINLIALDRHGRLVG